MTEETRRGPDEATEVCNALYRAYRATRFYPAQHPVAAEAIEQFARVLTHALDDTDHLTFDVDEKTLVYDERIVFGADDPRDNPAELLFLDGIRSITFHRGIDADETAGLVETLVSAHTGDRGDQDLATVLWERDFPHIDYAIVDPLLENEDWEGKGSISEQYRADVSGRIATAATVDLGAHEQAPEAGRGTGLDIPRLSELDSAIVDLTAQIQDEGDILDEFLQVLTEVLVAGPGKEEVSAASKAVSDVLASYLEWGEFAALAEATKRLLTVSQTVPERTAEVDAILSRLTTPDALRRAIFELDGRLADRRTQLEELLYLLRDRAYPALVELLTEAGGKASRKCILNVCTMGTGVPLELVTARLNDPRWYVVRNMVFMLGALADPAAGPHLERALDHADERVRREAARALAGIGGARAAYLLTSCLTDPAPSVRILAARSLARIGGSEAAAALVTQVVSKDFGARDDTEIDAFYDALGQVADDRALPFLDDIWGGRSLFRSKPITVRLGALKTIGLIGSPKAIEILNRAARSGDEDIRRQAKRSLLEAERRVARS